MMYVLCVMGGAFLGVAFMALCIAGKHEDKTIEAINKQD